MSALICDCVVHVARVRLPCVKAFNVLLRCDQSNSTHFVFGVLNVGGVVAQEETKISTVTSAGPTDCATSTSWTPGEVSLSLAKEGQFPYSN